MIVALTNQVYDKLSSLKLNDDEVYVLEDNAVVYSGASVLVTNVAYPDMRMSGK